MWKIEKTSEKKGRKGEIQDEKGAFITFNFKSKWTFASFWFTFIHLKRKVKYMMIDINAKNLDWNWGGGIEETQILSTCQYSSRSYPEGVTIIPELFHDLWFHFRFFYFLGFREMKTVQIYFFIKFSLSFLPPTNIFFSWIFNLHFFLLKNKYSLIYKNFNNYLFFK